MRFTSLSQSIRLMAFIGSAFVAHGAAQATAATWDSAALGYAGNGTTSANAWIASPAAGSSYAEWNRFDSATSDTAPDIAGAGSITELTGTGILTSTKNIYGPATPTSFTVTLAGATGGTWDVYLRTATTGIAGPELASLNGVSATRVVTFTSGAEQESLWTWSGLTGTGDWTFSFAAPGVHLSLDQVAVYAAAAAVPEPESWAMLAVGLGALALSRRRQRAA